jgi:hypothetical protein
VPDQPRPPAADGGADRGRAAEDPAGERESVAGAGVGGAVGKLRSGLSGKQDDHPNSTSSGAPPREKPSLR